jgi:hypothetical protein
MREAQGQARKRRSVLSLDIDCQKLLGESGRNRKVAIVMPELGNDEQSNVLIIMFGLSCLTDVRRQWLVRYYSQD